MSKKERLELIGLLSLAAKHRSFLDEISQAVRATTTEIDDCGHSCDFVYSDCGDADELLKRLDLKVK